MRLAALALILAGCSAAPPPPESIIREIAQEEADSRVEEAEARIADLEEKVSRLETAQRNARFLN